MMTKSLKYQGASAAKNNSLSSILSCSFFVQPNGEDQDLICEVLSARTIELKCALIGLTIFACMYPVWARYHRVKVPYSMSSEIIATVKIASFCEKEAYVYRAINVDLS